MFISLSFIILVLMLREEKRYMKIIKRNGTEVQFDELKITAAIEKANKEVVETERLSEEDIDNITKSTCA